MIGRFLCRFLAEELGLMLVGGGPSPWNLLSLL